MVSGGVHQQHAEQHDVSSDATSLGVVYLYRGFRPNLALLNIEEVDIMCTDMADGEDQHCIGDLSVEPLGLVQRKPSDVRA